MERRDLIPSGIFVMTRLPESSLKGNLTIICLYVENGLCINLLITNWGPYDFAKTMILGTFSTVSNSTWTMLHRVEASIARLHYTRTVRDGHRGTKCSWSCSKTLVAPGWGRECSRVRSLFVSWITCEGSCSIEA